MSPLRFLQCVLVCGSLALAACGNKGPLVKPAPATAAQPAAPAAH